MLEFDARGLSCPQPVLMAKKTMEKSPKGFIIVVDNETARENVKRFMESNGFLVNITHKGDDYELKATK